MITKPIRNYCKNLEIIRKNILRYRNEQKLMPVLNERNSNNDYSIIAKFLHWGFVFLFLYGILKQVDNISQLEDISLLKFEIIFAALFVLLVVIRFIYMKKNSDVFFAN
jgi:hypothetical protein